MNCENCKNEVPRKGMKCCSRKCADELKKKNSRGQRECLYCKEFFTVRKKDNKKLCSEYCRKKWASLPENIEVRINNSRESIKEKFGVDNVFKLEEIKKRIKETKKEKYGDENYNNYKKMIKTKNKIYGEEWLNQMGFENKEKFNKLFIGGHPLKNIEYKNKQKKTNINKYGVDSVSKVDMFKKKIIETVLKRYGVENPSQNKEIKEKKKQTSLENFGVTHHLKDYDRLQKHFKNQFKIKKYKDTELYYQGSYELCFLELLDEKNLLHLIRNGRSYKYFFNGKEHVYHTDFVFNGVDVEIKSGWTYNKNGKDGLLQELNETKWKAVIDKSVKLHVLIDKDQIKRFINDIK